MIFILQGIHLELDLLGAIINSFVIYVIDSFRITNSIDLELIETSMQNDSVPEICETYSISIYGHLR